MGPHFFKCGKEGVGISNKRPLLRFNGAALFQVRKVFLASLKRWQGNKLQWGRTFSSAERKAVLATMEESPSGFNGAALFQVRKGKNNKKTNSPKSGFNGAALFQVRKAIETNRFEKRKKNASMGPHFFKCGKRTKS